MNYAIHLAGLLSTLTPLVSQIRQPVQQLALTRVERLVQLILAFLTRPVTPATTLDFEQKLADELRRLGRDLLQWTFQQLEGTDPRALPRHIDCDGERYRIVNTKTHSYIDTLFGSVATSLSRRRA